jgi:Sigma-70 region 2
VSAARRTLVELARQGDPDAFAVIATEATDRLYAIAFRILRDPDLARDAVQETLLNAWRDLSGLRDPDRIDPWLYRLLVRACYFEARQRLAGRSGRIGPGRRQPHPDRPGWFAGHCPGSVNVGGGSSLAIGRRDVVDPSADGRHLRPGKHFGSRV